MKKTLLITIILTTVCIWARPVGAETIVVPGTGACEGILKELAASFNREKPGHEVKIPPSTGSGGGIRSVGEGESLLGRVARPIKEDEAKYGLSYLVFARDAVVFAVGSSVEVRELTVTQLADIFSGKIENWREVGGSKARILVLIREPGDSSLLIIRKHLLPFKDISFAGQAKILYHDYEVVDMLNKYKTAIGWLTNSSLNTAETDIKAVALDGIEPTSENVLAGRYKLVGDCALVYKEGRLNEPAERFVDFIFSVAGKRVIKNTGLVPVNRR